MRVFLTGGSDVCPCAAPPADWAGKLADDRANGAECCRPIQYPAPKAVAPTSMEPTKLFVLMTIRQIPSGLDAHVSSFALQGPRFEVFRIFGRILSPESAGVDCNSPARSAVPLSARRPAARLPQP